MATDSLVTAGAVSETWDPNVIRSDFPFFTERSGKRLAYLDNAATALKPTPVIRELDEYYRSISANVSRGVYSTSQEATRRFEVAREDVARFINASGPDEVIFTGGTTAALNLVANSYGGRILRPGDEILVTELEHHSNLVPWHLIAERTGARVRGVPMTAGGDLDLEWLKRNHGDRTKVIAVTHVSNALGTRVDVRRVATLSHEIGAICVVDGAQAAPHYEIDVRDLGCDFYAFSGHKLYGPTGVGVLYGRRSLLQSMPPWMGGGGMIGKVELTSSTYADPPARFEAGTPPIAEVLGLGAAIKYLAGWNRKAACAHEDELASYAVSQLSQVEGLHLYGLGAASRAAIVTFTMDGIHPHDVGTALDMSGVAVRVGHHCAQPLMARLGVSSTVRASFAPYNLRSEVDDLVAGLAEAKRIFGQ